MKAPRLGFVSILAFSALLLSVLAIKSASGQGTTQMVRLGYVEGDVRLSRGGGNLPNLSAPWQQAESNVLIEEGFSLATGSGRAEIEFDNGSIVYLAPNSLLIVKNLSAADQPIPTKNGFQIGSIVYVPADNNLGLADEALAAQIELATGTATIDLHPVLHQSFSIETPGGAVHVVSPQTAFMRVDSYLDAMALTPQEDMNLNEPNSQRKTAAKGQTAYFSADFSGPFTSPTAEPVDAGASADWDQWVSARVEQRNADTAAALKASGLSAPIPGLADLYRDGTFFACAPYGTCWQETRQPAASAPSQSSAPQSATVPAQSAGAQSASTAPPPTVIEHYFPPTVCFPTGQLVESSIDPATGKKIVRKLAIPSDLWMWPCREGSWVRRNTGFALVVRHHRHHTRPPVVWVRVGKQVGYVPRHPKDVDGKPPINLKYGVFVPQSKSGETVKRVPYNPSAKMEILPWPPKQFRSQSLPSLEKTDRPEIEAHVLVRTSTYSGTGSKISESPIRYDFKSQKFVEKATDADGHVLKPEVAAIFNSRGEFSSPESGRYAGYHFASSVSSVSGSAGSATLKGSGAGRGSSGIGDSQGRGNSAAGRGSANRGGGSVGGSSSASRGSGTSSSGGGGNASHGAGNSGGGASGGGGGSSSGGGSAGGHGPH